MKIKIYADGPEISKIKEIIHDYNVSGFTTNPTLIRKLNVSNYKNFCFNFLKVSSPLPTSIEVIADEFYEMERQARIISLWGKNVYVKIPITNTRQISSASLISRLLSDRININITAVFTKSQIDEIYDRIKDIRNVSCVVSIFAGRIADTGVDPESIVRYAVGKFSSHKNIEILWASCREALNIYQAESYGCDIITAQIPIIVKTKLEGKNLSDFSLDTVKMFYSDALNSQFEL